MSNSQAKVAGSCSPAPRPHPPPVEALAQPLSEPARPTFLGIGALKSASTWLSEVLRTHPEISMAATKEVRYFSRYYDRGQDWYLEQFHRAASAKHVGEFSPGYLCRPEVPARVHAFDSSLRFIVILRDPIDRAYSHYRHYKRHNMTTGTFLEAFDESPVLLRTGLYHQALERWWRFFPSSRIHLVLYDDIDRSPLTAARAVFRFLEIDENHSTDLYRRRVSPTITPRIYALETMRRRMFGFLERSHLSHLIGWSRQLGLGEWYRRWNNRAVGPRGPTAEERRYLMPRFEDDIRRLEESTGLDLTSWRQ